MNWIGDFFASAFSLDLLYLTAYSNTVERDLFQNQLTSVE